MTDGSLASEVIDAMREGVYVVDRDRRITVWNGGASRIAGFGPDEVIGRMCGSGILNHVDENGEGLCGSRCPLRATMIDGVPRDTRAFLHHREGHLVPVKILSAPLRDETGRIIGAVESFRDDTDLLASTRRVTELEHLLTLDPLTGIGNRRLMDASLAQRFSGWQRAQQPFGVLLADLDQFKRVNDDYGHDVGDDVLRMVGAAMTAAVRPDDAVVRFGGEEFLVVTGPIGAADLGVVADRIRVLLADARFGPGREELRITVSIGATLVRADDDLPALLRRADQLLLDAKHRGRDRIVLG